jgi:two-component system, cell cycle response regulator
MFKSVFTQEEFLLMLNFTTRLLALDLNEELLFERSLEALSDFSANRTAALLTIGQEEGKLRLEGLFANRRFSRIKREVPIRNTPLEKVIQEKQYGLYPARLESDAPLPVWEGEPATTKCLCLPLAGSSSNILGVVTIEHPAMPGCNTDDLQMLILLTTMIAISFENAHLFKLATQDGLTGLHVRAVFDIRLREEMARRKRSGNDFTILLADIDHFKDVNDSQGHRRGDLILREIAGLIRRGLRDGVDIACRYGGDEFIVLMTGTGREAALSVAERIRIQCAGNTSFEGVTLPPVTLSMGLVTTDSASNSPTGAEELIDRADRMLYQAKALGRNRVCTWL